MIKSHRGWLGRIDSTGVSIISLTDKVGYKFMFNDNMKVGYMLIANVNRSFDYVVGRLNTMKEN